MKAGMLLPKRKVVIRFALLCALMLGYFAYLSYEYNILTGGVASLLTWSFFVLCTPIADAGFLLDFPLRLLFGIRMIISEVVVWAIAIGLNLASLYYRPEYYNTTALTKVFHAILTHPYPYWSVIVLSAMGTFLSIRFGDELMDALRPGDRVFFHKHARKHRWLVLIVIFVIIAISYYELIASLGIQEIIA